MLLTINLVIPKKYGDCILRHHKRHSTTELQIAKFVFSKLINSSHKSKWRIGNNISQCSLCGRCEIICPTNAIIVSRHKKTWTLNNRRCKQCLNCIVKCPSHCLTQIKI
ncbi:MAG: hypothetical protein E7Z80_06095 [Methanobrevibacter thaueri]|nr:hypothetical protein [Methanobrevibacter thaueri]